MKKYVTPLVAGKLALGLPFSYAADEVSKVRPELTLEEFCSAEEALSLPTTTRTGVLYVDSAAHQTIHFMVRGIQKTGQVHVFLAYSKSSGDANSWPTFTSGQGQLELDPDSLTILAAMVVDLDPDTLSSLVVSDNGLGNFNRDYVSVVLPVDLSDLQDIGTANETIFFQTIAVQTDENGAYDWSTAQASEVDKFLIVKDGTGEGDTNNNGGDSGGK